MDYKISGIEIFLKNLITLGLIFLGSSSSIYEHDESNRFQLSNRLHVQNEILQNDMGSSFLET